jgi:hypothetical protein
MANSKDSADPPPPSSQTPRQPRQTSTERGGVGQSGYGGGRGERDPALDHVVETRHASHPLDTGGLGTDDRFTGRGGTAVRHDGERGAADEGPVPAGGGPDELDDDDLDDDLDDLNDRDDEDPDDGAPRSA